MKTPQEAAREYATKKCPYYVESDCDASGDSCNRHCQWFSVSDWTERANTFLAGAKEATRWISVKDELPEPGESYDEKYYSVKCPLFSESGYAFAEFGRDGCWVEDSTGRDITQYVTHWRPIEPVNK